MQWNLLAETHARQYSKTGVVALFLSAFAVAAMLAAKYFAEQLIWGTDWVLGYGNFALQTLLQRALPEPSMVAVNTHYELGWIVGLRVAAVLASVTAAALILKARRRAEHTLPLALAGSFCVMSFALFSPLLGLVFILPFLWRYLTLTPTA